MFCLELGGSCVYVLSIITSHAVHPSFQIFSDACEAEKYFQREIFRFLLTHATLNLVLCTHPLGIFPGITHEGQ